MIAAIRVNQPKDMLGFAHDRYDIRALHDHCRMRSRCHSSRARRQALRIRIPGMIDLLVPLRREGREYDLLTGQHIL